MKMSKELLGEELADIYCLINEAVVFHITDSMQSISFEIDSDNKLSVLMYVRDSINSEEIEHINCIEHNVKENYKKHGKLEFTCIKISNMNEFKNLDILQYNFFMTIICDDYWTD